MTKVCVVGYQSGATACSFNLAKSNWDRIKQVRLVGRGGAATVIRYHLSIPL